MKKVCSVFLTEIFYFFFIKSQAKGIIQEIRLCVVFLTVLKIHASACRLQWRKSGLCYAES